MESMERRSAASGSADAHTIAQVRGTRCQAGRAGGVHSSSTGGSCECYPMSPIMYVMLTNAVGLPRLQAKSRASLRTSLPTSPSAPTRRPPHLKPVPKPAAGVCLCSAHRTESHRRQQPPGCDFRISRMIDSSASINSSGSTCGLRNLSFRLNALVGGRY
jgi:hypothetical protein